MKRSIKLSTAALMLLAASGAALAAHHGGGKGAPGSDGVKRLYHNMLELNLSDSQRTELKSLMQQAKANAQAQRAENKPTEAERQAQKAEVQSLMDAPQFDEAQARALIASKQAKQTNQALASMKLRYDMMQVLSSDQRATLQAEMAAKQEMKKSRKGPNTSMME